LGAPDFARCDLSKEGDKFVGSIWQYEAAVPQDAANDSQNSAIHIVFGPDGKLMDKSAMNMQPSNMQTRPSPTPAEAQTAPTPASAATPGTTNVATPTASPQSSSTAASPPATPAIQTPVATPMPQQTVPSGAATPSPTPQF
jgi:hypothetical protein